MKCPKCSYLGFETGDRCRHCGYDFSLSIEAPLAAADLPLHGASVPADPLAPMPLDTVVAAPPVAVPLSATARSTAATRAAAPSLPLFHPQAGDDEPLVKVPAAPRPPLAVRRTPDRPRRSAPQQPPQATVVDRPRLVPLDPPLRFADEAAAVQPSPVASRGVENALSASGPARRLCAGLVDHLILLGVDAIVVYFTLKMAALDVADWQLLPPVPLVAFLGMLKLAYFCAFTLVGGQTIGKMALRIRVVADDGSPVDAGRAIQRTLVGAVSLIVVGAGLVPIALASDRRGLHDRVARTRVIRNRDQV